ncbi:hypothetical protein [Sulfuriroseicoccus oceanibius]|uniref:Uncharacterized protein n=1 Tax=Sulfuriroseicoccus oceanibius TaxID=2707525 RepID=A0A6B3L901_9BACT|nr:hypothetical protein [Sulfuriroseicoccus oceanibius]QQL44391.1 hypothetical protein G3M56_010915 [Sulfuriroseicoccus oceanibius]
MAEVKISERQFRTLLEMVNLATYTLQYHNRPGRDGWHRAFESVSDELMAQADKMGCGDLAYYDEAAKAWLPNRDYEEESFFKECIDDMAERTFWEDLVARMTDRDIARDMTEQQWLALGDADRQRLRQQREKRYWDEFEKRGVERVLLVPKEPAG